MLKRTFVAAAVAVGLCLAAPAAAFAQSDPNAAAAPQSGYASVNGLKMYYEIHGSGRPLVLLHGALMTIENFGELLPALAETRQVIAIEQQAHGRTADIERPFSYGQMAEDTVALLKQIGIERADFFGYSMGGAIALQVAIRHPELVGKLAVAGTGYASDGIYPEVLANIETLKPEDFAGSPWQQAYAKVAPNPDGFSKLLARVKAHAALFDGARPEDIKAIQAPALVMVGDSDVVRPEHAIELFRLLGGGVAGDLAGLPRSQLAVLPGTTHVTLIERNAWLVPMVTSFLDAPMPKAK